MRQFAEYFTCFLGATLVFASAASAQKPDASAPASPAHGKSSLADEMPVPVGQPSRGLRLPYRQDGKLKMFFNIDEMFRKDTDHLQMTNAKIQTFDDDGKPDMTLLLPVSTLDLNTRFLTSNQPFLVRRADFSLIGDKLQLDTISRQGTVTGKVKMIIFNFSDSENKDKEPAHE